MHPPSYSSCPRKFDITRILRFKITMFNAKVDTNWGWKTFAKFASFDDGEMTGGPGSPFSWSKDRENSVGCLRLDQHSKYFGDWYEGYSYDQAAYYSFPGNVRKECSSCGCSP